ncbi:MAG: glycosyltransferase [Saprospiraceae bacterium]|nr:glycosyltransferase [Saprospiraceae bacterium]
MISDQDCYALTGKNEQNEIIINPNGVDDSFFNYPKEEKYFDLVFVGNMGYLPNIEAVEFLVNTIMPLLSESINLLIAGARPHQRVLQLASHRVSVGGWYDDIREAYAQAKIFIAPIWSGTGQQNKILEAMAMGLPCITTSVVNNAIRAEDGTEIVLANDAETFSEKIKQLLNSEETILNIGIKAKNFVKQNYSWTTNIDSLSRIFASK